MCQINSNIVFETNEEYVSFIRTHCKKWLESPTVFYKGIKNTNNHIIVERTKRSPRDSHQFAHKLFGKITKENTGVNLREDSFIVTLSETIAYSYGSTYITIPIGNYTVYRSNVADMYINFMDYIICSFLLNEGLGFDNGTHFKRNTSLRDELDAYQKAMVRFGIQKVEDINLEQLSSFNSGLLGDIDTAHSLTNIIFKYFNNMYKEFSQKFSEQCEFYKNEQALDNAPKQELYLVGDHFILIKKSVFNEIKDQL